MVKPLTKLAKGVLLFGSFNLFHRYIGGADGLTKIAMKVQSALNFLPDGLAEFMGTIVELVIGLTMVYCAISGIFRICTFNQTLPVYEDEA
jgi:hypothetical protein